ncbi:MAG: carbon-nitrogen hydrolase family protein [Actinomycetota bacterium]|nr:carbon-nitrogen hydrolase family protein [Actinomycetota bacterium]
MALGQIAIETLDATANLERIARACEEAASAGAELVLFPELANIGQVPAFDPEFAARYVDAAEPVPGPFTDAIGDAARRHGLHVVVGLAERHVDAGDRVFDSAVVVAPSGAIAGIQRKLHPAHGPERDYFARGSSIVVVPTDLGVLSAQVCYDLYFPEVPRAAALRGAEILCGIANITDRPEWPDRLAHLASVRAYENMQHVAVVNRVGENHGRPFGGESVVAVPPGIVVARGPRSEEALVVATLHAKTLHDERAERPVFEDRRPEVYGL